MLERQTDVFIISRIDGLCFGEIAKILDTTRANRLAKQRSFKKLTRIRNDCLEDWVNNKREQKH